MLTPCIGCAVLIPVGSGGRCARCRRPARRYRATAAWKRTSAAVRAGASCADCGSAGRLEAHHVDELGVDVAAGIRGELVPLCGPCHDRRHGKRPRRER
jgi:hypothetical protein